jgi:hypothetical protein
MHITLINKIETLSLVAVFMVVFGFVTLVSAQPSNDLSNRLDNLEQQIASEINNRSASNDAVEKQLVIITAKIAVLETEFQLTREIVWGSLAIIIAQIFLRFFKITPKTIE